MDPLARANLWIESRLAEAGAASPLGLVLLLAGGLLAALLPCVYPLYPITATIVSGRAGAGERRWRHPAVYAGGMALMYGLMGLLAGLTGTALQNVLRLPAVNLGLALLMILLALATAGLLHLPLFAPREVPGAARKGLAGTFAMGLGAGLLSSSCAGPFVVGILVGILGGAEGGWLPALAAGGKMLAFGAGMALPFLLVGVGGLRLPRAGAWMGVVQWVLAVVVAWFAHGYLVKALDGWGFPPGSAALLLGGALLLFAAAHRLQPEAVVGAQRTWRALWVVAAVVGTLGVVRGFYPPALLAPPAPAGAAVATATGPAVERNGNLVWFLDREDALAAARARGRPVFVDFYGSWCANCKAFEKKTTEDPELNAALASVVLLKIQDTSPEFAEWAADPRFPELRVGLPFFAILDPQGHLLFKTADYTRTDDMRLFLEG